MSRNKTHSVHEAIDESPEEHVATGNNFAGFCGHPGGSAAIQQGFEGTPVKASSRLPRKPSESGHDEHYEEMSTLLLAAK
jgi:hypothetical protein